MDPGSLFNRGDLPDDPEGAGGEDSGLRGWIPPEDRLWRHPSELAGATGGPALRPSGRGSRRSPVGVGMVGVAAVVAVAAAAFALADAGDPGSVKTFSATDTSVLSLPAGASSTASARQMAAGLRPSLVAVVTTRNGTPSTVTGVVLPGGKTVLTAAAAVTGATRISAVTADGRTLVGRLMGTDDLAGIAVIDLSGSLAPASLPPASFADERVLPGEKAYAACFCGSGPMVSVPATVMAVGTGVTPVGGTALLDSIEVAAPLDGDTRGGVLFDQQGQVVGISDGQGSAASGSLGVFVPSALATGVAAQLATGRAVAHGLLGVAAANPPDGSCGAEVVQVLAGLPASAGGIATGDRISAVDGHQVCTLADLQARLYVTTAGQSVQLAVESPAGSEMVSATLAGATAAGP